MRPELTTSLLALALFIGMLLLIELGRRVGQRRLSVEGEAARTGIGTVEGAVFGLLGLLLAFSFSGAATRFDARRQLIVEEANDVGTAWLRLDLLDAEDQPALRAAFREYLDLRLAVYAQLADRANALRTYARSTEAQSRIWSLAIDACRRADSPQATMLLLPALNAMIDITTTRSLVLEMHPPEVVFGMLFSSALLSALFAGYGMAGSQTRSLVHGVGFALVVSIAVYVILDLEYPRRGLITVEATDHFLRDLRESMH